MLKYSIKRKKPRDNSPGSFKFIKYYLKRNKIISHHTYLIYHTTIYVLYFNLTNFH